ncbi:unnamed protein product [Rotaria sp. Silwood2]|nr:unnamed protein product [Rotaria sp. Silwood2]
MFIFFGYRLYSYPVVFYFLLYFLLDLDDVIVYAQGAAAGGFFAQINDVHIGGTYYTLLASLTNAGQAVSSSLVLYTANWFPTEQAYFIEVGIYLMLGLAWFTVAWQTMHQLQALSVDDWHLTTYKRTLNENHHDYKITTIDSNKQESPTITTDIECSSWL